jgi:hypothetical protein
MLGKGRSVIAAVLKIRISRNASGWNRPGLNAMSCFPDIFKGCFNDASRGANIHAHEAASGLAEKRARTHAHASVVHEEMPELVIVYI